MKKKILTVVGARPQFIKAFAINNAINKYFKDKFEEIIVHTGQHYDKELSDIFFSDLNITKPLYNLGVGSNTQIKQISNIMIKLEDVIKKVNPDVILTYGDTNSTLATALCAAKLYIPCAHIEAGVRSFFRKMPEEINRILTDSISEFLFSPTKIGIKNLKKEGVAGKIYLSGDVMLDVFLMFKNKLNFNSKDTGYILFTLHREINTKKETLEKLYDLLMGIKKKIIWPIHPRTYNKLKEYSLLKKIQNIKHLKIIKPVGYIKMMQLLSNCNRVITDSGGLVKEAYFMGKPCITLRNESEWPELFENNWNVLCGFNIKKIHKYLNKNPKKDRNISTFGDGKASIKILDFLYNNL